jgi:predicted metal-dependent hydrolase
MKTGVVCFPPFIRLPQTTDGSQPSSEKKKPTLPFRPHQRQAKSILPWKVENTSFRSLSDPQRSWLIRKPQQRRSLSRREQTERVNLSLPTKIPTMMTMRTTSMKRKKIQNTTKRVAVAKEVLTRTTKRKSLPRKPRNLRSNTFLVLGKM